MYVGSQMDIFAGMLLIPVAVMGLLTGVTRKVDLILLIGTFLLILVSVIAIAAGIIPFGTRIVAPVWFGQ